MAFSVGVFALGCDEPLDPGNEPPVTPPTTPENPTEPEDPVTPPATETAIQISTESELRAIANDLNGNYELTQNITLTQPWSAIGNELTPFNGILDGKGYTISNLTVQSNLLFHDGTSVDYNVGLFGVLKGKLKNLTVDGLSISVTDQSVNATDYNSIKSANLSITDLNVNVGLVGTNKGNIKDIIVNNAQITVNPNTATARARVGVIAGKNNDKCEACTVSGTVNVTTIDGYIRAGGIAGYVSSNGQILDNRTTATINATVSQDAKIQAGGLVGNIECGIVTGNYSSGAVTANNAGVKTVIAGGLIGEIDNKETAKYADMSVTVSGNWASGNASSSASENYTAGFIGQIDFDQSVTTGTNTITITNNEVSGKGNSATSFGLIRQIINQLDAIVGSTSFVGGVYGVITITGNGSVIADSHATTITQLTLPTKWQTA